MFINTIPQQDAFEGFREDVRAFCAAELSGDLRVKLDRGQHLTKEEHDRYLKALAARGWLAGQWPKEHGGQG